MRTAIALALLSASSLVAAEARADRPSPPAEKRDPYSPYERQSIEQALTKLGRTIESQPDGKIIDGVDVVSLDVFEDRDPLPAWLTPIGNWFHVTSKPHVIAREALVTAGERWDQSLVDQTARNLRGFDQLSLVLCVPLRSGADHVRLLIITKDVWSLRLNSDYTFANGRLQHLLLQPSEQNLLGTHQQILGNFVLDPGTITLGGQYIVPRLDGSRVKGSLSANALLNRDTGKPEGSYGSLSFGQPLYSTRVEWAWGGSISWDYEIVRRTVGGLLTDFDGATGKCDLVAGDTRDAKLCQYRRDALTGSYSVTRSFGGAFKHDLTLGVSASRKQYRSLSAFTGAERDAFAAGYMPVSDTQIGPYLEYHDYSTRYFDVLDLDTLGLTESYQRGHDVTVRVSPVSRAFHSSRNFVELYTGATYTVPLGDGFVRAAVSHDVEIATDTDHGRFPDASLSLGLRIATPRFGHGRFVFLASMLDRYQNYLNVRTSLGGDGRLRGYPANLFLGQHYVAANLEYRSDPVELSAIQLGFTLFADVGDAFDDWKAMQLKQSAGFGFRLVFPQLQRSVMRLDLGFPLTQGVLPASQSHVDLVVTFGQAF
jgi:hypothetical protein